MTKTKYYDLQMDDPQDDYDVEVVNANLKKIDEQMKTRENATDALQEPEFTVADKRENIASKEKMQKILGKIAKFFTDLKTVAFTGNYKDLSNKPTSLPASDVSAWAKESTKPKYTKAEVGLGNVGNFKAVSTVASQGLTNTEKSNARANIGAQAAGSYASSTHNHDSTYRKKLLGTMDGDGKTSYCQLCTLKISQNYINTPIEITLQERCRSTLDRLSILFGSINNTNPSLDRFTVFGESCDWYISKTAASTWVIYGLKGESWAGIKVVDYTGIPGIDITWNMTGVSSLPDSKTQALWGGNVHYAETAGNVVNNQTTTKAGFALDARQANPNLDGTLAKQVADLNGSLNDVNNFRVRKVIDNWSSSSQVSGGCGIYKINTIEDKFYNLISKNVTTFKNVGDYTLMIFSWNGLETLSYSSGLLTSPRSTTFCFVQVWDGDFILYDV